jgi:predicted nucleotidyltransferase
MQVRPETVIKVLQEADVRFVVIGTHALNGWRDQSRATQDIDLLVRRGHHLKAIKALHDR